MITFSNYRQSLLLLLLIVALASTTALTRHDQPGDSATTLMRRRRTAIRGASSGSRNAILRELGVGHDGKYGKSEKGNKSARSPKSQKQEEEAQAEELPHAEEKTDQAHHKSPKGGDHDDDATSKSSKGDGKRSDSGAPKGKSKGNEHFQHEGVETFRRDIPDFAISYAIPSTRSSEIPGDGDYNELAVVSEEFLDRSFRSVFEDMPVGHFGTAAYAMINTDTRFTVDFRVTLDFGVPGEVPTVQFLLARLTEAFEREASANQYLFDLNDMSTTNPFSATTSFTLIAKTNSDQGTVAGGLAGAPGSNRPPPVSNAGGDDKGLAKKYVFIIFFSAFACLLLGLAALMWFRGRNDRKFPPHSPDRSNNLDLPVFKGKLGIASRSENGDDTDRSESSDAYGADDETVQYLKSLRQRYRDEARASSDDATIPRGYKDVVDDDKSIKEEQNGVVFLRVGNQANAIHSDTSDEEQNGDERANAFDLLNLELNATDVEDDLGSF